MPLHLLEREEDLSIIIDAHEDIAWGTLCFGRDYLNSAYDIRRYEENGPVEAINGVAMLGLPEWLRGGIAVIGATLFTPPERRAHQHCWSSTTAIQTKLIRWLCSRSKFTNAWRSRVGRSS